MNRKNMLVGLIAIVFSAVFLNACATTKKAAEPAPKAQAQEGTKALDAAKGEQAKPVVPSGGIETATVTENRPSEEELGQRRRAEEERRQVEQEKQRQADAERQKQTQTIQPETLEVVYFDFDKSEIKHQYRDILAKNADTIKKHPHGTVVVEGHCDERGTNKYNIALGDRRASSVRKYLVSLGVDESRLKTVSYGEEKPIDPSHNDAAWSKNRRVQFSKE